MEKNYFFLKLTPSRSDFAQTMTHHEKSSIQQHLQYCQKWMEAGQVVVFGPVLDPAATYGVVIMAVTDESQVQEFIQNDPLSPLSRYEYYPMRAMVAQG